MFLAMTQHAFGNTEDRVPFLVPKAFSKGVLWTFGATTIIFSLYNRCASAVPLQFKYLTTEGTKVSRRTLSLEVIKYI